MSWKRHRDANLAPLAAVWQAAEAAGAQSVFQTYAFARHWAACFADEAEISIAWRSDPPVIIPLARCRGRWGLLGEGLFDYQDLVGAAEPEVEADAARWLASQWGAPVTVTGVPEASPWRELWRLSGLREKRYAAAPLRPAGADDLAAGHPRVEHRWRAAGVTLAVVSAPADRLRMLDWLLARKAAALEARNERNVLGPKECRWVLRMVEQEPAVAELWQLRRRGDVVAGLLCWLTPQVRYAYTIAYEPGAAAMSPGVLALYALLRHTRREGRAFNFLTGEQAFKQRFATAREELLRYQKDDGTF
ncbi:MAG: GNAT family N-acetyltransferase [Acidobacteria bacterium]|nr:MAG: GNAT family N-acetyltransferase [Acidobacteriota bacterium]